MQTEILEKARKIKLLLLDCDGVLTDGRLYYTQAGEEIKVFHVHDGQGLVTWHKAGFRSGIISGRDLSLVETRARELGIDFLRHKSADKLEDLQIILEAAQISPEETAFIGDDIADVDLMKQVGFAAAVADAMPETKEAAHYVARLGGGLGAVREVIDLILQARGNS
jgi:3-deoxy-D-manno-octulosonate 8-phosphate phosphatase (KDO 8-P phosphatase)